MNVIRKYKTTMVMLGLFALNMTVWGQEQMLSFEEAMQMMLEQNPALLQQKEEIRQREFEIKSKRGLHMPIVSVNAQAVTMSDPLHLDLTPVGDAIAPLYTTLGNYGVFSGVANPDPSTSDAMPVLTDEMSTAAVRQELLEAGQVVENSEWDQTIQEKFFAVVSAGFVWPLYTGGKIKGANQAADVQHNISKEALRHTQGMLLAELVTRYYGLALGMQVVKLRDKMLKSMENHYSDAKKLFDNGMIAKVELLHAEVAKNEAERELKKATRNVKILRTGLKATLANDSLHQVIPASNLFINKEITGLEAWIEKAKAFNPQLMQIHGKKELVEIKHRVEKNEYLPTLAALGNYNIADKDLSPYVPEWLVGVGLKWTLFEGAQRKNNIRASKTMYNQVAYAEQKANDDLEAYLVKLFHELQMQMEQKTELETTLALANEYCSSTEKAFIEGFANSTTVVEAHTKVLQAKTKRLKVLYDYDVTLVYFLQTVGMADRFPDFSKGGNVITETL
ncbi:MULTISPECIES: TolC family protein [unclassified Saccharicrinis]|uniref:TolC family protein n=1 Tax=unclassified Saccharicrinis TaxID=2646859 RepID=UPI003D34DFB3